MFERFTDQARQVIVQAQEEARSLNHDYVSTEHLLLGLLGVERGIAARALNKLGISLEGARAQVEKLMGKDDRAPGSHLPFTPSAKKILEFSIREALQLGHNYIGTEHLLLALIRQNETAAEVIRLLDGDIHKLRQEVVELLIKDERSVAQASAGAVRGNRTESDITGEIHLHETAILRLKAELKELKDTQ